MHLSTQHGTLAHPDTPPQMCAVVAKLMQQFHILIPRDLHVTLRSVAVERSVVSDLSTSSHGRAGTDSHSHIGGSRCYKLTPVCSSDGGMKKSPVTRLLLMHTKSVSLSGFPRGLSLPCFPLAPIFSYSILYCGEERFPAGWVFGAIFLRCKVSLWLCICGPLFTPQCLHLQQGCLTDSFILCLVLRSYPVERRVWIEQMLLTVGYCWFFLYWNNLMALDFQVWATVSDKGR